LTARVTVTFLLLRDGDAKVSVKNFQTIYAGRSALFSALLFWGNGTIVFMYGWQKLGKQSLMLVYLESRTIQAACEANKTYVSEY